jgi:hypothetical protein
LVFDGETFLVDAEAVARVSFRSMEFDYTWWAWADQQQAFGFQLGLLRFGTSLSIRGRVSVPDEGEATGSAAVSERFFVPLIGLAWRRQLGDHWRLESELRYLRRSYRDLDGEAISGHLGLEWLATRHISLILQYGYTNIDVEQENEHLSGTLEIGFRGPQALLRLRF